jgi:hypothetical protein
MDLDAINHEGVRECGYVAMTATVMMILDEIRS